MTLPKLPLNLLHEDVNKENIYNPAVRLAMKNSLLADNIVLERQTARARIVFSSWRNSNNEMIVIKLGVGLSRVSATFIIIEIIQLYGQLMFPITVVGPRLSSHAAGRLATQLATFEGDKLLCKYCSSIWTFKKRNKRVMNKHTLNSLIDTATSIADVFAAMPHKKERNTTCTLNEQLAKLCINDLLSTDPLLENTRIPVNDTSTESAYQQSSYYALRHMDRLLIEEAMQFYTRSIKYAIHNENISVSDMQDYSLVKNTIYRTFSNKKDIWQAFLCPELLRLEYSATLDNLVRLLAQVENDNYTLLFETLINQFDSASFTQLIDMLKRYLTRSYIVDCMPPALVLHVLVVMKRLYLLACKNEARLVDTLELFQCPELEKMIDFRKEYLNWQYINEGNLSRRFTLLDWPFLFDIDFKSYLVRIHAITQMHQASLDASVWQGIHTLYQRYLSNYSEMFAEREQQLQFMVESHMTLELRRNSMVEDVLNQLMSHANALKRPLRVKFVRGGEEGVDQGGLQKEMFEMVAQQLFDPVHDVGFPMAFEAKLLGHSLTLPLLHSMIPDIANGLQQLLDWPDDNVETVFSLTFSVDVIRFGQRVTEPLIEHGVTTPVTNANRHDFVALYLKHLEQRYFGTKFEAFKRGFSTVCDLAFIRKIFEPSSLYWAMRGSTELDFTILENNTTYEEGFTQDHQVIRYFWQIIHDMQPEQQREFLRFVTASDRAPPRGLQDVRFSIQRNGPDTDRLPSAYTCFGRLLLPEYSSMEKMREKLLIAIHNYAGFGLV
ncbi:hypothetical protein BDF22DRAFT_740595 [Syncephalis plumigaleata]|nr:hypothetical protein BDF22DRAFT_740595 [Syncephalis plumigaleata]